MPDHVLAVVEQGGAARSQAAGQTGAGAARGAKRAPGFFIRIVVLRFMGMAHKFVANKYIVFCFETLFLKIFLFLNLKSIFMKKTRRNGMDVTRENNSDALVSIGAPVLLSTIA